MVPVLIQTKQKSTNLEKSPREDLRRFLNLFLRHLLGVDLPVWLDVFRVVKGAPQKQF
jgi:hypothetical protein